MPINVIVHHDVAAGTRILSDASNTDYVINAGVLFGSSDLVALQLVSTYHDVWVNGTVVGGYAAVRLGNDSSADYGNALRVSATGLVQGGTGLELTGSGSVTNAGEIGGSYEGISIQMSAYARSSVVNDGAILGTQRAIQVGAWEQSAFTLVNRGLISSENIAVSFSGLPGATASITNHGTIQGEWAYLGGLGADTFLNRGDLLGHVGLYEGNDRFDNRGGRVEGRVEGGTGDDLFLPGTEAETFLGDSGVDTLDFQGSAGLRVSLLDDSGTGRAEGDVYIGFERIVGSRGGADTLVGDDLVNTLIGSGGDDRLQGRGGGDLLEGGAGLDQLTGGTGDDIFNFLNPGQGGDLIADFRNLAGNDDRFELSASGFGAGLVKGVLPGSRFVTRLSDNLAQDADDRFIFRKDNATLWFDADGKGGAAAALLADLHTGAVLGGADILIV